MILIRSVSFSSVPLWQVLLMMIFTVTTIFDPFYLMLCSIISNWYQWFIFDNNIRHMMVMILIQVLPLILFCSSFTFCWYVALIGEGLAIAPIFTSIDPFNSRPSMLPLLFHYYIPIQKNTFYWYHTSLTWEGSVSICCWRLWFLKCS